MSCPWRPLTDFEEEIVNLQPHNDFIFGGLLTFNADDIHNKCPRPPKHLEYIKKQLQQEQIDQTECDTVCKSIKKSKNQLELLSDIQRMAGVKSIGEQVTLDDWNNYEHIEQETIGMMRYFGMEPSIDEPLSEDITLATYPIRNMNPLRRNGRRIAPLFFDDDVFKLRPLIPSTEQAQSKQSSNSNKNTANKKEENKNNSLLASSVATTKKSFDGCKAAMGATTIVKYMAPSSSTSHTFSSQPTSSNLLDQMSTKNKTNATNVNFLNRLVHNNNEPNNQVHDKSATATSTSSVLPPYSRSNVLQENNYINNNDNGALKKNSTNKQWPDINSSINKTLSDKKKNQCSSGQTFANIVQTEWQQQQQRNEDLEVVKKIIINGKKNIDDDFVRVVTITPPTAPTLPPRTTVTVTFKGGRTSPNHKNHINQKLLPFYTLNEVYNIKRTKSN